MDLGPKFHTAGAKKRWVIDYSEWLDDGRTLNQLSGYSVTISTPPAANDITISGVTVTAHCMYFFVQGGTANQTFTLSPQITDTLGEILPDTISFTVKAP